MIDRETLERIKQNPEELVRFVASQRFPNFARYIDPKLEMTNFHKVYYDVLDRFAHGKIKKLIISVSPQSGKSQGSSRFLPAFLLGMNPDLKIVIGSYNADQAKSFNRDVQRIINSEAYKAVFPDTFLNNGRMRMDNVYQCNSEVSEPVGHKGFVRGVGRSGALTGKSVDILILDDVYKDFEEANSGLIREQAWNWYSSVCRTRLHNDSQEIIVFTRWHQEDIVGKLENSQEKIIDATKWSDFDNVPPSAWVRINFPALKMGEPTELDPRNDGEALWPSKHSKEKLLEAKALDPTQFMCLYQGTPSSAEGRLYGDFKTYTDKSEYGTFIRKGAYVEPAGKGTDYTIAFAYDIYKCPTPVFNEQTHKFEPLLFALITDVIMTQDGMEITKVSVPQMLNLNGSQKVWIEQNNGGDQYGETIAKKIRGRVELFFTSHNKEARIISNVSNVMQSIVFPLGWETRWETLYKHLTNFLRYFKGNPHDDPEDALSGIVEKEIIPCITKPYNHQKRGIKRQN